MKKIQVSLPDPTAKEMNVVMKEKGYESESECGRHIIQEYLLLRRYGIIKEAPGGVCTDMVGLLSNVHENQFAQP